MAFKAQLAGWGSIAALLAVFGGCGAEQKTPSTSAPAMSGTAGSSGSVSAGANAGGTLATTGGSGGSGGSAGSGMTATGGVVSSAGGGVGGGGVSAGGATNAGSSGAATGGGGADIGGNCAVASSALVAWPGQDAVKTLDMKSQFESDLSGLTYEPGKAGAPGVLWAVDNLVGTLFRMIPGAAGLVPDTANGWAAGKQLRYPNGMGEPDAEGVTFGATVADGVYVCTERNSEDAATSRLSVLRYDVSPATTSLTATHEWNLTALLPTVDSNLGLEGITWVPDSYLTAKAFYDEGKAHIYAPTDYPNHGTGLVFVGVEQTGKIHVMALNHQDSSAALVATIATPNAGVMGLEFDRDANRLWFDCDDTCGNKSGVLDIDTTAASATRGHFVLLRQFNRPSSLPDSNNEGIAIGPATECNAGFKPFYWTDDDDKDGFSLREDAIPCACF